MKKITVQQVDAFTDKIFGGNPAAVVIDADRLTDDEMKNIAREMNLSETAFVFKPTQKNADFKIRYFTSGKVELDFCGHATIGTLYELARLNMYGLGKKGQNTVHIENNAGILTMFVTNETKKKSSIAFIPPQVIMEEYQLQGAAFADACNIPIGTLRAKSKVLIDRKLNYLYIPIISLEKLGKLTFDADSMLKNFSKDKPVAFCFFTNNTFDKKADLHARVTCPFLGLDEDPVTGSTQAGLVYAAKRLGMVDNNKSEIISEQGYFVGRSGFAQVKHDTKTDSMLVIASAAHVFSTEMRI